MSVLDYIFPKKLESGMVPNWEVSADEAGEVHVRRTVEPQRRSIYSQNDPSPVARIASRFLVEVLPGSATREQHQTWFLFWRLNAKSMVDTMKAINEVKRTDYAVLSDVNRLAKQIEEQSLTWENFLSVAQFPVQAGLKVTAGQLRAFVIYAFQVADAGWGAHVGDMPEKLIAQGTVTAEELEADYLRRIAIYQSVFQLLTDDNTRFLLTGEEPALSGSRALGVTGLEVAAVIVGVLAVVFICACLYSAYQTYAMNAVFERQAGECQKVFIRTGQESELCKDLPKQWSKTVTDNPANTLAEDFTFYLFAAAGVGLGIMFLPEIVGSFRRTREEARAARSREKLATNRRR